MSPPDDQIEKALFGMDRGRPLRTVRGYHWIQHLATACICADRGDSAGVWHHCGAASRSFVASLQLLHPQCGRTFVSLSDRSVYGAVESCMLPTRTPHPHLFASVFERFKAEAAQLMALVEPTLEELCELGDFGMLSNVYLNAVSRMPDGVGVYFVHERQDDGFTDVSVHGASGIRRFLAATRSSAREATLSDVKAYYAELVSRYRSGAFEPHPEELLRAEFALSALVEGTHGQGPNDRTFPRAVASAETSDRIAVGM